MVKVSDFQNLRANATRVRVDNAAQGNASPVRTGPTSWSLGGRMVARVKEWLGAGKAQNTNAGLALINAVQQEYGNDAANTVRDQLQNRALQGKPLSARRVNISLDLARQNAFASIKDVPAWQAHLKASQPHESPLTVLSQFLQLHAQSQPPVFNAAQMSGLLTSEHGRQAVFSHLSQLATDDNDLALVQAMEIVDRNSEEMELPINAHRKDAMEQEMQDALTQLPSRKVMEQYPAASKRDLADMQYIGSRKQEEQLAQSRYGITPEQFYVGLKASVAALGLAHPAQSVFSHHYLSDPKAPPEQALRMNLLGAFQQAETLDDLYQKTVTQFNHFQAESFVPGGSQFNDMLNTVASEVLGAGVDTAQIPLRGLGERIQNEVASHAKGPDGKIQSLTPEQVKSIATDVLRSHCEDVKAMTELPQTMAAQILAAEPNITPDRLQVLTNSALEQYKTLMALAEGDATAAMEAFAQAQTSMAPDDASKILLRNIAIGSLRAHQLVKAYQGLQSSAVVGELLSYDLGVIMGLVSPYDDDASHEYKSVGLLFSMGNEMRSLREGLNIRLGLSEELAELNAALQPKTGVLSEALRSAANLYREVALATAIESQKSPEQLEMLEREPLHDLTHALPRADPPNERAFGGVFRSMAAAMNSEMKLPLSQNLFMPQSSAQAGAVPSQGLSQSGRNRLDLLQTEANTLLDKHKQPVPVGRDWAQAQNEPRMRQFKLDVIERQLNLQLSQGEQLSSMPAGEPRWERWNTELEGMYADPVELDNARTELAQLLTQTTFGDLGTSPDNLDSHGWMPLGFDSQDTNTRILGKDTEGYLKVVFSHQTTVPGLVKGDSTKPIQITRQDGEQIDCQMHAQMRYKPSDLPGVNGDVRFDQHMAHYKVTAGLAD